MLRAIKWLALAASVVAAFVFWKEDRIFMMIISIVIFLTVFLTNLWMQNIFNNVLRLMTELDAEKEDKWAKKYPSLNTEYAMDCVPNWLSLINFVASLASFILLVVSLIIYFN